MSHGILWVRFNETLVQSEKQRGRLRYRAHMCAFKATLEENQVVDLGCRNNFFSWSNKHTDNNFTKKDLIELMPTFNEK